MKQHLILFLFAITTSIAIAQPSSNEDVNWLKKEISFLKQQVSNQKAQTSNQQDMITSLQNELVKSEKTIDSLQSQVKELTLALSSAEKKLGSDITKTNKCVDEKTASIEAASLSLE